jgi:hypothetical protein
VLSKYVKTPVGRKLESYVGIKNGKVYITKNNTILVRLYISSDLYGEFDEIKCFINLIGADGEEKTIENTKSNFKVTEGDLVWEFSYACVSCEFSNFSIFSDQKLAEFRWQSHRV